VRKRKRTLGHLSFVSTLANLSAGKRFPEAFGNVVFSQVPSEYYNSLFRGHSINQAGLETLHLSLPDGAGWTRESTTWTDLPYGVAVFYLNGNVHSPFSHLPCFSVSSDPALCCVFL